MDEVLRKLALENGVIDQSYGTVRYGMVASYKGRAEFVYNGNAYIAIGHGPTGTAETLGRQGYIEFITSLTRRELEVELAACLRRAADRLMVSDVEKPCTPKEFAGIMFGVLGGINMDMVHVLDKWDRR